MLSVNKDIDNTVEILYKNLKQQKENRHIHLRLDDVFQDETAQAVVSVYIDEEPAHKVLEDLIVWAKSEGLNNVVQKINELSSK